LLLACPAYQQWLRKLVFDQTNEMKEKLKGTRIADALYLPYILAPYKLFYMLGLKGVN
jgi:hypothetical protein